MDSDFGPDFGVGKGFSASSPVDPTVQIHWGRFAGLFLNGQAIVLVPQAFSVLCHVGADVARGSSFTLPYGVWIGSEVFTGRPGFQLMFSPPTSRRGSAWPILRARWALPRSAQSSPASPLPSFPRTDMPPTPRARPQEASSSNLLPPDFVCADCRFHRSARSSVSRIAAAVSPYSPAGQRPVLNRLSEQEAQKELEEDAMFSHLSREVDEETSKNVALGFSPTAHSACGLREWQGVMLYEQAKNPSSNCQDARPRTSGDQKCATCRFRLSFDSLLLAIQECLSRMGQAGQRLYGELGPDLQAQLEFEATEVAQLAGFTSTRPVMFAHCAKFSADGRYAIGEIVNSENQCGGWEPGSPPAADPSMTSAEGRWQEAELAKSQLDTARGRAIQKVNDGASAFELDFQEESALADGLVPSADGARLEFLRYALATIGVSPGRVQALLAMTAFQLHEESRIPYSPPPPGIPPIPN